MIWLKRFEVGKYSVTLYAKRFNYCVKCTSYKAKSYPDKKYLPVNMNGVTYTLITGSLSECNDRFNQEVNYLTATQDENLYELAKTYNLDEIPF